MSPRRALPFTVERNENVKSKANEWIGDVFYDELPSQGYEVREEQIYTAFRMHEAYVNRQKLFAEAGLGTGKTFAYLVGAVLQARQTGRPVVIACGSNSLVDQLVYADGDIAKLSKVLGIDIDARAALDPTYYICARKLQMLALDPPEEPGVKKLLEWADTTRLGARFEIPDVSDELWDRVRWEEGFECGECHVKYRCPVFRSREYYRQAADLIVCTHAFFFRHLRMKETLKEQGHLPLIPNHSAIIFDEAHRVEDTARRQLGDQLTLQVLLRTLDSLQELGMRESFALILEQSRQQAITFFDFLIEHNPSPMKKTAVVSSPQFRASVRNLRWSLEVMMDELSIEEGLTNYTRADYSMQRRTDWARLNRIGAALDALLENSQNIVCWLEQGANAEEEVDTDAAGDVGWDAAGDVDEDANGRGVDGDISLWVAPFDITGMMRAEVYRRGLPVIFSSATLASGSSFTYIKDSLGAPDAFVSQVPSPYDYTKQCMVYVPDELVYAFNGLSRTKGEHEDHDEGRYARGVPNGPAKRNHNGDPRSLAKEIVELLHVSNGRSLILFQDFEMMAAVRNSIEAQLPDPAWPLLWEGDAAASHLLKHFTRDVCSVLFGVTLWEGISVVGPALSQCIIAQLPFPEDDPIIEMKRRRAELVGRDPFQSIDVPEMIIKLKQGAGRLIRSTTDAGVVSCLDTRFLGTEYEKDVFDAFPSGAVVARHMADVRAFFQR